MNLVLEQKLFQWVNNVFAHLSTQKLFQWVNNVFAHLSTHTQPLYVTSQLRADPNFLTYFTGKWGPSISKWSTLSMWNEDWNVCDFNRERTFIYIQNDSKNNFNAKSGLGYLHNVGIDSHVFNYEESNEAKTNSGYRVCPLSACIEEHHQLCFSHILCVYVITHTQTYM